MDGPQAKEWEGFETKVMLRDVWKWIKEDELAYTPSNGLNIRITIFRS